MQAETAEIKTYFQNRMAESKKIWAKRGPDARQVSVKCLSYNFYVFSMKSWCLATSNLVCLYLIAFATHIH